MSNGYKKRREITLLRWAFILTVILMGVVFLGGCGAGNGKRGESVSEPGSTEGQQTAGEDLVPSPEPLVVEAEELDYDRTQERLASEIRDGETCYAGESLLKSETLPGEWKEALEPFQALLNLRILRIPTDTSSYEGLEKYSYIQAIDRDGQGYTYVTADKTILLLDPDGVLLAERSYGAAGSMTDFVGDAILSDTGEVVFPVRHYESTNIVEIVGFDRETGAERILGRMEDPYFRDPLCALLGERLFYRSDNWIVDWNLSTGERTRFFDLRTVGAGDRDVVMGFDGEGSPLLYIGGKVTSEKVMRDEAEEELIVKLTSQPASAGLTIRVSDVIGSFDNNFVQMSVGMYDIRDRTAVWKYHTEEDRETHRTRVLAEIAAGNGADVLCMNREDIFMLWEKGAIAPLEELISQDTLDALLPSVRELGSVDGELVGIPPLVYVSTFSVSRKDWDQDSWSMEEFMERTKALGKKYAQVGVRGSQGFASPGEMMILAGLPSLEGMGLVDYENGKANLDCELYRELLSFCKEYGLKKDLSEEEYQECQKNRETMADVRGFLFDFGVFENVYKLYEEGDCNLLGFPAGDTSCNYVNGVKWIAVSRQVLEDPEKKEAISGFLEYLLSKEGQRFINDYLSVRRLTEEDCYENGEPETYVLMDGSSVSRRNIVFMGESRLTQVLKADGSSYLGDFMEFLENCKPQPYYPSDVNKIVMQEATAYFQGTQSLEDTVRVTQNRVQLYLNENR